MEKRCFGMTGQHDESAEIDDATIESLTAGEIFRLIEELPAGYPKSRAA